MPEPVDDSEWLELLRPYYQEFGIVAPPAAPLRLPFDEAACAVVQEVGRRSRASTSVSPMSRCSASPSKRREVIGCATTVEEAQWLDERGADAIIAQGFEAGGTPAASSLDPAEAMGLIALLPQVVDASECR